MFVALLDSAQIGVLRGQGGAYLPRAVPVYPTAPTPLGAYKFDVSPAQLDVLIREGVSCLQGVMLRELLLTAFVVETILLALWQPAAPAAPACPSAS